MMQYTWKWKRTWVNPAINVGALGASSLGLLFNVFAYKRLKNKVDEIETDVAQYMFKTNKDADRFDVILQQASYVIGKFNSEGKVFLESHAREIADSVESHPASVEMTLFQVNDESWDYEEELKNRSPDAPYIIHRDEFHANERDYRQSTLTYYKADRILCDEADTPVYNIDTVVGKLEFGKGSNDPSIVYIRNEALSAEYEILLDHGWYQVEVLGQAVEDNLNSPDVKHSLHKFREE